MLTQLPKQFKSSKGFTLVELLVVIAIIAILATVGLVIFSGQQKNARDSKRKSDIDAIATALENGKTPGGTSYNGLAINQFVQNAVPLDPGSNGAVNAQYSYTGSAVAAPSWDNTTQINPTGWSTVGVGTGAGATAWTVCAHLETSTTAVYCKSNAQS
ncbi:type II secretion system protein [Candidatus Daviesbacteria bacterium]|nr:type II secretion system protein [Candidatus Daviesbacteria bacterium]